MRRQKFITSHRFRVKRAKARAQSPDFSKESVEAYAALYLLEDVKRLYEYRLRQEEGKEAETAAGERAKKLNIEKFSAVISIFGSAYEVAKGQIDSGNYASVKRAIPERALRRAADNTKNLPRLREIAVALLRELMDDALHATEENQKLSEGLTELDDHERNVRRFKGLPEAKDEARASTMPSPQDVESIIRAAEEAIPDRPAPMRLD